MKFLIVLFITVFSFQTWATDGFHTRTPAKSVNAIVIGNLLASDKTPAQAKEMLSAVINGQDYENRTSILSVEQDAALGQLAIAIRIGTDLTTDDDNGWSVIYEIRAVYQRNSEGNFYELKSVELVGIAG